MKPYITHPLAIMVRPKDEPIFSEMATSIQLDDESGGPFVVVKQSGDVGKVGSIAITKDEWPAIRSAIDTMIALCDEIESEHGNLL